MASLRKSNDKAQAERDNRHRIILALDRKKQLESIIKDMNLDGTPNGELLKQQIEAIDLEIRNRRT